MYFVVVFVVSCTLQRDMGFIKRYGFPNVSVTQDPSYLDLNRDRGVNSKIMKTKWTNRDVLSNATYTQARCVLRFSWYTPGRGDEKNCIHTLRGHVLHGKVHSFSLKRGERSSKTV